MSGAAHTAVNGVYSHCGESDGVPMYAYATFWLLRKKVAGGGLQTRLALYPGEILWRWSGKAGETPRLCHVHTAPVKDRLTGASADEVHQKLREHAVEVLNESMGKEKKPLAPGDAVACRAFDVDGGEALPACEFVVK